MNEVYQEKALEALRDWSKWLIGLNTFAGAGCLAMLQKGGFGDLTPFLIAAIAVFALAVVAAALLIGVLAVVLQRLPLRDSGAQPGSVFDHRVWRGVRLRQLAWLQFGLFVLGIVLLLTWIMLKPAL